MGIVFLNHMIRDERIREVEVVSRLQEVTAGSL